MRYALLTLAFLGTLASASSAGGGTVWIVDGFGRPGSDFTDIQSAVDAASDGDAILVRESYHYYAGFEIVDKALVITAEASGNIRFEFEVNNDIRIADLSAGKTVQLNGLGTDDFFRSAPTVALENNDGTIWLEGSRFEGARGTSLHPNTPQPGISIEGNNDVVVVACQISGHPAIRAVDSSVHVLESELRSETASFQPPFDGSPGMLLQNSFAFVTNSTVAGSAPGIGFGIEGICFGNGGDGVLLEDASTVHYRDTVLEGGTLDPLIDPLGCVGVGTIGSAGSLINADGTSAAVPIPGAGRRMSSSPLAREGEVLRRTVFGQPGDHVFLASVPAPDVFFDALLDGTVLVGAPVVPVYCGVIGATGQMDIEAPIPDLGPSTLVAELYEQTFVFDAGGASAALAGTGAGTLLLDRSIPNVAQQDCNQNGIEDDDDIRFGSSRDCNENGVPDDCEPFVAIERQEVVGSSAEAPDGYAFSVAADGGVLAVGAPRDGYHATSIKGTVFLFELQGGLWTQTRRLRLPAADRGGRFGNSVALENDRLVVGAPKRNEPGGPDIGGIYVFDKIGGEWTQTAQLIDDADGYPLEMGRSVTIENGVISATSSEAGRVILFEELPGGWIEQADLAAPTPPTTDVGAPVVRDGDLLMIGAHQLSDDDGVVRVYRQTGATWSFEQEIPAPRQGFDARFGWSLALTPDTLLVGAVDDPLAARRSGVLYSYERLPDGTVDETADPIRIHAKDGVPSGRFTSALLATPELILAGSAVDATSPNGAVFGFLRSALGGWNRVESFSFVPQASSSEDEFGHAFAIDGTTLFVCAPGALSPTGNKRGTVYVYDLLDLMTPNPCGPVPMGEVRGRVPTGQ